MKNVNLVFRRGCNYLHKLLKTILKNNKTAKKPVHRAIKRQNKIWQLWHVAVSYERNPICHDCVNCQKPCS